MRRSRKVLAASIIVGLMAVAGPAHAYPRKGVLTAGGWNCWRNETYFVMGLRSDDVYTRSHPFEDSGKYRYNRDKGKVNFTTGPLKNLFGKLSEGLGGWDMTVKNDETGARWGDCQNYTAGGM